MDARGGDEEIARGGDVEFARGGDVRAAAAAAGAAAGAAVAAARDGDVRRLASWSRRWYIAANSRFPLSLVGSVKFRALKGSRVYCAGRRGVHY